MKKLIYLTWALLPTLLQAQVAPVYLDIDSPQTGSKVFVASDYISFKPGFHFKATDNDSLHAYIYQGTQDYALATYQDYVDPATTPINKSLPVGSLPASFSVSSAGAATYHVPIELPTASVALMPNISLNYDCQSGNGAAGIGWHLQGFSAITRVNKSNYYDGKRENISFTADDAIAFDGQRLIHIEGAPHGSTGAIYATERENYIRVEKTSDGYKATFKNGTIMEYGYTPDARKLQQSDDNLELGWFLNKVTDLYGNYYTIHYKNFGNGEVLPDYVNYSSNDLHNLPAYNQVRFSYMDRNDKTSRYINGQILKTTKLLSTIHVLSNGKTYRKYLLKYFFDHISKLNQITLTGVNGIQYNPTIIGWENTNLNPVLQRNVDQHHGPSLFTFGDYDGDGKTDMTKVPIKTRYYATDYWNLKINTLDTRNPKNPSPGLFKSTPSYNNNLNGFFKEILREGRFDGLLKIDFNADGLDDILLVEKGDLNGDNEDITKTYKPLIAKYQEDFEQMNFVYDSIAFPRVTHFLHKTEFPFDIYLGHEYSFIADVNGDGSSEILTMNGYPDSGEENIDSKIYCDLTRFVNGSDTTIQYIIDDNASRASSLTAEKLKIGDFNGDGKEDIYLFTRTSLVIYTYNATTDKFEQLLTKTFSDYPLEGRFHLGDFNGDGSTDLIELNFNPTNFMGTQINKYALINYQCYLSNGINTLVSDPFGQEIFTPNITIYYDNLYMLDFNGDGRTDILHQIPANTSSNYSYSYGDSFQNRMYYNFPGHTKNVAIDMNTLRWIPKDEVQYGDFNGDGIIDLFCKNHELSEYDHYFHDILYFKLNETPENVITNIQDGNGKQTNIAIKPVTASGVYHPYQNEESIIPIPVVHEVSYPQINNNVHERYAYGLIKIIPSGKGFLGIGARKKYDLLNNTTHLQISALSYQQFIGQAYLYTKPLDSNEVSMFDNFWDDRLTSHSKGLNTKDLGNKRFKVEKGHENFTDHLNQAKKTIAYSYDAHGNVSKEKTIGKTYTNAVIDSTVVNYTYIKQGNGAFDNTVDKETKTATRVGEPSVSTTTEYDYNPNTYLLDYSKINQGSDREIITQYHYNTTLNHLLYTTTTTNETDPNGQVYAPRTSNVQVYDNASRYVLSETNALGHTTTITSMDNMLGLPLKIKDANNRTTTNTYDGFGQLLSTTNAEGIVSKNTVQWYQGSAYPDAWYFVEQKTTGQPTQRSYYNAVGQELLTETETLHGNTVKNRVEYHLNGQVHKQYLPYFTDNDTLFNQHTFDEFNRPKQLLFANGVAHSYNYVGNSTSFTTSIVNDVDNFDTGIIFPQTDTTHAKNAQTETTQTNGIGQIVSIIDAYENETTFEYNSFGSAKSTTSFGSTTTFEYDEYGKQKSLSDPNAGLIQYTYNVFGELVTQINADGATSNMFYDVLGRITSQVEPDGRTITYTYDSEENAIGALVEVSDGQGNSTTSAYDEYGRVLNTTETINNLAYVTSYTYDNAGRIKTHTYPSGFTLSYLYDYMGNIMSISNASTNQLLWEIHEQNAFGNLTEYQYGNGLVSQHTYDAYGFLTGIKASDIVDKTYLFEKNTNNLHYRTCNKYNNQEIFDYDKLNRLTHSLVDLDDPTVFQTTQYDANGNITTKPSVGQYTYNSSRPHALTGINAHLDTTNGNLIRLQTAEYNHFQDLVWVKEMVADQGEYEQTFSYNALNQRNFSKLTLNGQTIKEKTYVGEYELITESSAGLGSETKAYHYISAPSGLVGVYVQESDGTGQMLYTHQDYLGSIIAISDEEGILQQELSYDAWGRQRHPENHSYNSLPTPLLDRGYTLHEHMPVFGLIHMNGRLYDPQVGRMLSPDNNVQDPANGQNYNRYSYVLNNPLKYTDPTGEVYQGHTGGKYTGPIYGAGLHHDDWVRGIYEGGELIGFQNGSGIFGEPISGGGSIGPDGGVGGSGGAGGEGNAIFNMVMNGGSTSYMQFKNGNYNMTSTSGVDGLLSGRDNYGGVDGGSNDWSVVNATGTTLGFYGSSLSQATKYADVNYQYRYAQGNLSAQQFTAQMQRLSKNIANGLKYFGRSITGLNLSYSLSQTLSGNASWGSLMFDVTMVGVATIPFAGVPLSVTGMAYKTEILSGGTANHDNLYLCFVAGTRVKVNDRLIPIEQLTMHDSVSTYNEKTGGIELMKVQHTGNRIAKNIYEVITSSDTLMVTGEHPFFVLGKNWVTANELMPNDRVKSLFNEHEVIISTKKLTLTKTVYNLEVATNHNYFVGKANILVHNKTRKSRLITTKKLNKELLNQTEVSDESKK